MKILNVVPVTENIGGMIHYMSGAVLMAGDAQGMRQYVVTFEHDGRSRNINVCVPTGKCVTKDDVISALISKAECLEDELMEQARDSDREY